MLRWLPVLIVLGLLVYLADWFRRRYLYGPPRPKFNNKPFKLENLKETWIQIYETASKDEAERLKVQLEELEIQSIVYEQGKKGVDGTNPPGIGFAVPKSQLSRAQNLLLRFLGPK